MILRELVLTDFGAFAGRQVVPLEPRAGRPVVLIGALNGTGKTTILEALQLVLFGALAPHGSRRGLSHEAFLLQTINDQQDQAIGASVELAFQAHFEGELQELRVTRRWWRTNAGRVKETVSVDVAGEVDSLLSANWTEYVEAFVPRGVAGLFFFDGEQIESFADLEASKLLLQTAINGLLGLDIVDRLVGDLEILERRKRSESIADAGVTAHLQQLTEAIDRLRSSEQDAQQRVEAARRRLMQAKVKERTAEEAFELEGGAQHERRAELESARTEATAALAVAETRLLDACADTAPLLLVQDLLKRTHEQAQAERGEEVAGEIHAVLAQRDAVLGTLLKRLERQGVAAPTARAEITTFLRRDRDQRRPDRSLLRLRPTQEAGSTLARLVENELDQKRQQLSQVLRDHGRCSNARDRAERAVASVPTADALEELVIAREQARAAVLSAGHIVEELEQLLEQDRAARERAERNRERTMLEAARESLDASDTARLVEHAERARVTLRRLREIATSRHAAQIRAHVLDALRILLRKEHLVADVEIDAVTYQLSLLDQNGGEIPPVRLSAGERQMVAVSLLWGLAKAAGRPLPVVIDTPLGRLDGTHRARFVESYLPHASHQVIVLSTDTEIDQAAIGLLDDAVSHTVHLVQDPTTGCSRVESGYVVATGGTA